MAAECRAMIRPYQIFLELNDIEHRRTRVARPRTNGFVERFHGTALDGFFREAFRAKFYASVEELQADFDTGLLPLQLRAASSGAIATWAEGRSRP